MIDKFWTLSSHSQICHAKFSRFSLLQMPQIQLLLYRSLCTILERCLRRCLLVWTMVRLCQGGVNYVAHQEPPPRPSYFGLFRLNFGELYFE